MALGPVLRRQVGVPGLPEENRGVVKETLRVRFFFSSRRRHTRCSRDWSSDVCSSDLSKAYAMTGWRLGYCGGPREIITAMSTIQGQSTSNDSSISQKAATTALNADQTCVTRMTGEFKKRRDYVVRALNSLPGVSCLPGSGTFYAFADVSRAIAALGCRDDGEFAELLLNEAGGAVVPGSGFRAPRPVRLSFACGMPTLEKALDRIARLLIARVDAA